MAEELLLYVESDETPYPGEMPLRFPFEDGATRQVRHPFMNWTTLRRLRRILTLDRVTRCGWALWSIRRHRCCRGGCAGAGKNFSPTFAAGFRFRLRVPAQARELHGRGDLVPPVEDHRRPVRGDGDGD